MFGFHFVKNEIVTKDSGRFFSSIFDKRLTGDYDDFIDYTKDDVLALIDQAKELIEEINKLKKINRPNKVGNLTIHY